MVKPVILQFEGGEEYTLEFSRETIAYAEDHGFSKEDFDTKTMVRMPELFFYAFRMHHPEVTREQADGILFNDLGGVSSELAHRLVELYNEGYKSLINVSGKPKNPKLTVRL